MDTSLLSQSVWLELPQDTRSKLAKLFNFPEKGGVQVQNGPQGARVISDGYGYDSLKLVTLDKMNELLGTDTDNFYSAFKDMVNNLDELCLPPAVTIDDLSVDNTTSTVTVGRVLHGDKDVTDEYFGKPKKKGGRPVGSKNKPK